MIERVKKYKLFVLTTFLVSASAVNAQSYTPKEILSKIDSLYAQKVGLERFEQDWETSLYSVSYTSFKKLGKQPSRHYFLNPEKNKRTKGNLEELSLSYDYKITFEKCPYLNPFVSHQNFKLNGQLELSSYYTIILDHIPEDYWNNKPCDVLDSSVIKTICDTIAFRKGLDPLKFELTYNSTTKKYEWKIWNLIKDEAREAIANGSERIPMGQTTWELVFLDAKTGSFIRRRIQYPFRCTL